MPRNLFGRQRNQNPLLALLQQEAQGQGSPDELGPLPQMPAMPAPPGGNLSGTPPIPTLPPEMAIPEGNRPKVPGKPANLPYHPGAPGATTDRLPPRMPGFSSGVESLGNVLGELGIGDLFQGPPQLKPPSPFQKADEPKPQVENVPDVDLPSREGSGDPGHAAWGAMDTAMSVINKHAGRIKTQADARQALFREFQDTPEIDQAIQNAEAALAQAKTERKTAGPLEYIAIALMNLSGVDPRVSADMVLNLGDQREREQTLEGRLFGLEQQQAGARMGGRRDFRRMELEQGNAAQRALQQQLAQAERKRQFDEEMGFKSGKAGLDAMQRDLGQLRQQASGFMDEKVRAQLMEKIRQRELDPRLQKLFQPGGGSP